MMGAQEMTAVRWDWFPDFGAAVESIGLSST
jgi:hypothetical protein